MKEASPWALAVYFASLSLVAFGGANAILPDMHRYVVEQMGWISDADFSHFFAVSRSAPGPNVLIVTLIGLKVSGWGGALAATAAMCAPSCLLTYWASKQLRHNANAPWALSLRRGLVPLTIGLMLASAWVILRSADHHWQDYLFSAFAALWMEKIPIHPLWLMLIAALLGAFGML